jgi:hypothetical protein
MLVPSSSAEIPIYLLVLIFKVLVIYGIALIACFEEKDLNLMCIFLFEVRFMDVCLLIDGEEVELNEFVKDFLGGTIQGAISPLRDIKDDWNVLQVKITR